MCAFARLFLFISLCAQQWRACFLPIRHSVTGHVAKQQLDYSWISSCAFWTLAAGELLSFQLHQWRRVSLSLFCAPTFILNIQMEMTHIWYQPVRKSSSAPHLRCFVLIFTFAGVSNIHKWVMEEKGTSSTEEGVKCLRSVVYLMQLFSQHLQLQTHFTKEPAFTTNINSSFSWGLKYQKSTDQSFSFVKS